ncbi:MAG: glycoside hydrolase family 88 protein [Bacteroidales bacterium]|nr:glycoside hydrolase family 88 protein [Bacteroidales bacterium]
MVESRALTTYLSGEKEARWNYVAGLVANSVLKTWLQYPEQTAYYEAVKRYADACLKGQDTIAVGESNLDDLAAGKIFFVLYRTELAKGNTEDATRYKNCVTFFRNKMKHNHSRIALPLQGVGGFFHKAQYPNQMWLDGLYMGPALYAEWQYNFGEEEGLDSNNESWTDIANQFITIHTHTYNAETGLNYHAWSADPEDPNSFWAKKKAPYLGCSYEFWGRGMGWYFAALVDVLELMPKTHEDYIEIQDIANQVAAGLKRWQDNESGCWFQLLQYGKDLISNPSGEESGGKIYNQCDHSNYLESSASSMFTYAYLKGIRTGTLNKDEYLPVALKAYKGLLDTFIRTEDDNTLSIIQSCNSAGLGPARNPARTGTINYYLCGPDVTVVQNEGKAIGPFIMASLEYELLKKSDSK